MSFQKQSLPPANNIGECLSKPPNTPVPKLTAIIVKVGEVKAFTGKDGRPGTRVPVRLRDPTGEIAYTFFSPPKVPELNDIVEIINAYVKPPYQPGGANEIGLSQFPKNGVNPECKIIGKGTPPPAVQAPAPLTQDPAAAFFGLQPNPGQQAPPIQASQPQQMPSWTQPQAPPVQQAPVVQQSIPQWASQQWAQSVQPPAQHPVQSVQPVQQAPAAQPPVQQSEPDDNQYPDSDAFNKADLVQAVFTVAENVMNLGLRIEEGFKVLNGNIAAIYGELSTAGADIESKFDLIYARLIKNGVKAEDIFTALAKNAKDSQGLIDPKIALGIIATEKGIDITDLVGKE